MTRSAKKGPYVDPNLEEKIHRMNSRNEKRLIKSWARASSVSPDMVGECVGQMARVTRLPLGCYPSIGAPRMEEGVWSFDPSWTPERFAEAAAGWVSRGAQMVGGCCGTGPEHIRALRLALPPVLVE